MSENDMNPRHPDEIGPAHEATAHDSEATASLVPAPGHPGSGVPVESTVTDASDPVGSPASGMAVPTEPAVVEPGHAQTVCFPSDPSARPWYEPTGDAAGDRPVSPGYAPPPSPYSAEAAYQSGGYPTAAYQAGGPATPGYPGSVPSGATSQYPAVAYPTAGYPYPPAGDAREPRRSNGVGKVLAVCLLALLLAGGGGVIGGLAVHHFDKTTVTYTTAGGVPDNAPIVDRSSLASIAAAVRPSVVSITTGTAEGSGVVLSSDGYILTNNHVAVTANGANVNITFDTGDTVKAVLVGTDPKTDLAVFKAQNLTKALTVAKFGDSSALQVGDTVLAIGSPLGLDGSVTAGIVSALNRTINETSDSQPQNPFDQNQTTAPTATIAGAIQTDAAINPGNSGGALVNTNGEVVGINTAIATSGNGADGNIGVGFSIPSNRAKQVADDIIKGVTVSHPYLGIGVTTADSNAGAVVGSITAGSPAEKAGLKKGDVITSFNGKSVHTSDDLVNDVQASSANTAVTLSVVRNGATMSVSATLGESK